MSNKIQIGDTINWRGAWGSQPAKKATIEAIELTDGESKYGTAVTEVPAESKDLCVFSLTNGHWAYGWQIDLL
jgi:hypothetical protein